MLLLLLSLQPPLKRLNCEEGEDGRKIEREDWQRDQKQTRGKKHGGEREDWEGERKGGGADRINRRKTAFVRELFFLTGQPLD